MEWLDSLSAAPAGDHPALAWRRAGLAALTGEAQGPPLVCPAPLTTFADAMMARLRDFAAEPALLPANGSLMLGERGRMLGLKRNGRVSPNGSCRLLDAADGWVALNLPRPDDWGLLPALFEEDQAFTDWPAVAEAVRCRPAAPVVERAIELGLAVARGGEDPPPALCVTAGSHCRDRRYPRVLDLSSLWAGPLCASLLGMLGAHVIKAEHHGRPDGARHGDAAFFGLLNDRKQCIAFDFTATRGRLASLVDEADIVIEASRPRALRRLGIVAEDAVARGAVWISITGHGRGQPHRIGFGDDCAAAGGLVRSMAAAWGRPLMTGDAIADPLTGLLAALAAWSAWLERRGALLDVAMSGVVARAVASAPPCADVTCWQDMMEMDRSPLYPLRVPSPC